MRKPLLVIMVGAGVAFLLAGSAGAAVFTADFESPAYTSGAMPNVADAVGQRLPAAANALTGQGPWGIGGYTSNPAEVGEPWFNDAFVVADPSNAGNHVAAFFGDQTSGPVAGSGASVVLTVDPNQDITFTQDAYYSSTLNAGLNRSLLFTLLSSSGGPGWNGNMNVSFGTYGYYLNNISLGANEAAWSMWDSNAGTGRSLAVPMDTWTTASVTFHVADKTADFSVTANGVTNTLTGLGASYMDMTQTKYNLSVDGNGATGAILLDNVVITPEPATMILLTISGVGLLLRRRHA
jgi:hypothetical protein